jgi:xylulokinase
VEVFAELGMPATRVLASDGGAASELWLQIIADALDRPVQRLKGHPGSCLGAAWMAAMGTGLADDWSGVSTFVTHAATVEPKAAHRAAIDTAYAEYRSLYTTLKPWFHACGATR